MTMTTVYQVNKPLLVARQSSPSGCSLTWFKTVNIGIPTVSISQF